MFSYFKHASLAACILASAGLATAEEYVEMSLTTSCDCYQSGSVKAKSSVFVAAVVEVPRQSVEGRSLQELRDGMTARQYLALQDAATSACRLQAMRNLSMNPNSTASTIESPGQATIRAYCANETDFDVKVSR